MKTLSRFTAVLALTTLACAPAHLLAQDAPPPPDQQYAPAPDQGGGDDDQGASFQTFYDQLGSQGTWIQTDDYGYVFQPNVSDPDWAPYTDGHWVYTDEGWTWDSDEPWGWATYHYGRWANIDGTGWVWVPGYRWAPAWVSWRYGGGYAGWAPLPPETFVGAEYGDEGGGVDVGVGFHFGNDVDVNFNIGPGCYNFVNVGDLGERNYRGHYLDRGRNYTVINRTTNITNINVNQTVVNNYYGSAAGSRAGAFRGVSTGGPSLAEVNAHAHNHVQTVHLAEANQPGRSALQGNSLAVYAPRVNPASQHTARPAQVGQTISHPAFNRGDSITKPLAVTSSIKPAAPSAEAITAAKEARQHAPATAKIATENTHVKTQFTQPLSAMQPVAQTHHTAATPEANHANGATSMPKTQSPAASSAFTGESEKPAATHPQSVEPAQTYHPQAQSSTSGQVYHPQTEAKPESTYHPQAQSSTSGQVYHPQTEAKPESTYHPQAQSSTSGQVYHPQTEAKPESTYHPQAQSSSSGQVYHPQTEAKPEPTFHTQSQAAPAPSFHPQSEAAPVSHPQASAPAVHPQAEVQHEAQHEAPHTQAAPAAKPAAAAAPAAAGGNKNEQGH